MKNNIKYGFVFFLLILFIACSSDESKSNKKYPQLVSWIESSTGDYISTVIVTKFSSNCNWKPDLPKRRPEALPIWNNKIPNDTPKNLIDAVSSATPKDVVEIQINNDLLIDCDTYNIYLEINHSFDYNISWTKNNSGVNGQPSVLYHANFIAGQICKEDLSPIGYGSVDGSNGDIIYDVTNITTALDIIKNVYIITNDQNELKLTIEPGIYWEDEM